MKKIKINGNNIFVFIIFALVLFRIWLALSMPLIALGSAVEDDALMFGYAKNIAEGHWLGGYNFHTLLKGVTYSLLVALFYNLNISYSLGFISIYIFSCYVMVRALKPVIQNKYISAVIFILLLYSPVMMNHDYVQRLYRMAAVPPFVLLVFGFQIGAYLRIREESKKLFLWLLGEGISLALFWYIREDSLWVLPFITVSSIVMLVVMSVERRSNKAKSMLIMPFASVAAFTLLVGGINYVKYDTFELTELRLYEPNQYNRFMKHLENISPDEEIDGVEVTRAAIMKGCDASPTLNTAREAIEEFYDNNWDVYADDYIEGEIKGSYYWWAMKYVMQNMGLYENPQKADMFLKKVNSELQSAFDNGVLIKKENAGFFNTLIKDKNIIFDKIIESTVKIAGYSNFKTKLKTSEVSNKTAENNTRLMEILSGGRIIYPDDIEGAVISGWITSNNNDNEITAYISDSEGNVICPIEFYESPDVYEALGTDSSKKARFSVRVPCENVINNNNDLYIKNDFYLKVYIDENYYKTVDMKENPSDNDGIITYNIDSIVGEEGNLLGKCRFAVNICNFITAFYKIFALYVFALSLIAYVYITVKALLAIKKPKNEYAASSLILTAFLLSSLVLLFIVCYRYRNAWNTDGREFYLAGVYPLMQMFKYFGIVFFISDIYNKYIKKTGRLKKAQN